VLTFIISLIRTITPLQIEGKRYENSSLRAENDKLRIKCVWLREAINNGCLKCCNPGCPLNNEQYLRLENARLQEEVIKKKIKKIFIELTYFVTI